MTVMRSWRLNWGDGGGRQLNPGGAGGGRGHPRSNPKRQACIYVGMASMTEFNLAETIAILSRTPAALDVLLRGLPDIWVHGNEGKDTWSAFDIVGHLIVGERDDWMPRARLILENGEARPFDPFDRWARAKQRQAKELH